MDPCGDNNGGCGASELCLLSAVDPGKYSCIQSTAITPTYAIGTMLHV